MINILQSAAPSATLDSPVEHLSACHRRIEERLQTLERVVPHLRTSTSQALTAIQAVFWFFDSSGVNHMADEEESFFPRIANGITIEEREFLQNLEAEHAHVETLYDRLKALVAALPDAPSETDETSFSAIVSELCALYRQHIRNEDARFPAIAARTLTDADLTAISKEMKQRRGI